jgi:hypothetical protein
MWTRAVEDRRKNLAPRRSLRRAAGQHLKIDARTASAGEFAPGADEEKKIHGTTVVTTAVRLPFPL